MFFSRETQHIKSHFAWIAEGGQWSDADLVNDLRADTKAMTASEVSEAKQIAREGAKRMKEAKGEGSNQLSRDIATETAGKIVDLLGDRIVPAKRDVPDDPRELAKLIRR